MVFKKLHVFNIVKHMNTGWGDEIVLIFRDVFAKEKDLSELSNTWSKDK